MSQLSVFKPGSKVLVGFRDQEMEAIVTDAMLGRDGVQYKVAWYDGRNRKHEWVDQAEVSQRDHAPTPMRFLTSEDVK